MSTGTKRKKSKKRVETGKRIARSLPRDKDGKFLPRGSKNLFKRKRPAKRRKFVKKTKAKPKRRTIVRRTEPMRRGRGRAVTTTDRFPNYLTGFITGALAFQTKQVFTPIPRVQQRGKKATIMELLYMETNLKFSVTIPNSGIQFQMTVGQSPTTILPFNDPRTVLEVAYFGFVIGNGPNQNGAISLLNPFRTELQTRDGFGYLMASDTFNISLFTTGIGPQASEAQWRLYYRFVEIPLEDFIGIVQSIQQA